MKKILILSLILLLSGCSAVSGPVSIDQVGNVDAFYIQNGETVTPLLRPTRDPSNTGLKEKLENGSLSSFLITEEELAEVQNLDKDSQLVFKSNEYSGIPFNIYKLEDLGTTVGLKVKNEGNSYYLNDYGTSLVENSSAYDSFSDKTNRKILAIGGERLAENIVSEVGTIKGLNKDQVYRISTINGTIKEDLWVTADTHVFKFDPLKITSSKQLIFGDNGFVTVTLPELEEGYYFIEDPENESRGGIFHQLQE